MLTSRKLTILHRDTKLKKEESFMSKLAQKLVGLFFIFLVLFNFPMLNIFWKSDIVLGVPLIYLYLFTVWLLLIIALIWHVEFRRKQ